MEEDFISDPTRRYLTALLILQPWTLRSPYDERISQGGFWTTITSTLEFFDPPASTHGPLFAGPQKQNPA